MKNKTKFIIFALIIVLAVGLLAACNQEGKIRPDTLIFMANGIPHKIVNITDGLNHLPGGPQKDGYEFHGWYWDKDVWKDRLELRDLLGKTSLDNHFVYACFVDGLGNKTSGDGKIVAPKDNGGSNLANPNYLGIGNV